MTYCVLNGGPADGLRIPTADHWCTRRIVIYRGERGPPETAPDFARPAVYLRDETDQGTTEVIGMDGVKREFPTLGYRFERSVPRELAAKIERVRQTEADAEEAEGRSV